MYIREMTDNQKNGMKGKVREYPDSFQSIDGTMLLTTKSVKLPDAMRRREVHCYKHNWPQGKNVQAVVLHFGHATEILIGIPTHFPSLYPFWISTHHHSNYIIHGELLEQCLILAMSHSMCLNDPTNSTLVDTGCPAYRPQFVRSDGASNHAKEGVLVERYFAGGAKDGFNWKSEHPSSWQTWLYVLKDHYEVHNDSVYSYQVQT